MSKDDPSLRAEKLRSMFDDSKFYLTSLRQRTGTRHQRQSF